MVKNISLPVNSRKIAILLTKDIEQQGYTSNEIKIRTTLSDEAFDNLFTAIRKMKDVKIIPVEYTMSKKVKTELLAQDFIEKNVEGEHVEHSSEMLQSSLTTEEETQYNNFKLKAMKGSSSKIPSVEEELDRFEQKYSKPMQYLKNEMPNLDDLQAYAVIFATDNLGLQENSKERIFEYLFNRHYKEQQFYEKLGSNPKFPSSTGMNFIDLGREYSLGSEIVELGQNIKTLSGLDTYSENIIEEFFFKLLTNQLTKELYEKKVLWRWSREYNADMLNYVLPAIKKQLTNDKYYKLQVVSIAQLLLFAINPLQNTSLEDLFEITMELGYADSSATLAKKITKELQTKTLEKQVGVTLSNYFKDMQTNPGSVDAFCEVVLRYYDKIENPNLFIETLADNIRSGLLTSTGMLKNRLNKLSYDKIEQLIRQSITSCDINIPHDESKEKRIATVKNMLKYIYSNIKQSFEQKESKVVQKQKGGMKAKVTTFWGSINYLVTTSPQITEIVNSFVDSTFDSEFVMIIAKVTSYITYRIAGQNDIDGQKLHYDLAKYFVHKYEVLGQLELANGQKLLQTECFESCVRDELVEASVLVSLGSRIYSACVNAWPSIKSLSKNTQLLIDFVIPNILYWQRLPRKMISELQSKDLYTSDLLKPIIQKSNRMNPIEAYSLLLFGLSTQFKSMADAKAHIMFSLKLADEELLKLHARTGEAEVIHDVICLWNSLKPFIELDNEKSKLNIPPVELALNITKGFAREFNGRDWFNQIYFAKLSVSQEEEGFIPLLYQFEIEANGTSEIASNLLMTYYYPDLNTKSITQLAGIVIIGGEPRIENAFQITKTLTPVLESLILDRCQIDLSPHRQLIANVLTKISNNITVKGMKDILEVLEEKSAEQITSFYPIFGDADYKKQLLSLPNNFQLHAIFILEISEKFFHTEHMGEGIKTLSFYRDESIGKVITGSDAFPLIIKWQPLYNDIQTELQKYGTGILPKTFTGYVKPKIIIFKTQDNITGLITKVTEIDGKQYINIGIAKSGSKNGQPLSLLDIQLNREKFGSKQWKERITEHYDSSDAISYNLSKVIDEEYIQDENGMLDLGKIKSFQQ